MGHEKCGLVAGEIGGMGAHQVEWICVEGVKLSEGGATGTSMAPESRAVLACLNQRGIRRAYADYWLSYKLTFLSGERIIVAPRDGLDRYPAYTALVLAANHAPTIVRPPGPDPEAVPCSRVLLFR